MITLGNLLKSSLASIIITSTPIQSEGFLNYPTNTRALNTPEQLDVQIEDVINNAISQAIESFGGRPYSWETGAYCSSYVARYLSILGLPVERVIDSPYTYVPRIDSPIPDSSTYMQLNWFENFNIEFGGGYLEIVNSNELEILDWATVPVGSLLYLEKAGLSQYGTDEVAHVAIFSGFNEEGEPLFSDFAAGMSSGPMTDRTIRQLLVGVNGDGRGGLVLNGTNGPVHTYIINVTGILTHLSEVV